jgi:hypothetical protein
MNIEFRYRLSELNAQGENFHDFFEHEHRAKFARQRAAEDWLQTMRREVPKLSNRSSA